MKYVEIRDLFNLKLDKEVNGYFSDSEIAIILNSALYRLLEDRYRAFESSNRIPEHISPLVTTQVKSVSPGKLFIENVGTGWAHMNENSGAIDFEGWLYPLDLKIELRRASRDYNANAVDTVSTDPFDFLVRHIPCKKINIDSDFESDPYLHSNYGINIETNQNFDELKLYYQIKDGGIRLTFNQPPGFDLNYYFYGHNSPALSDIQRFILTCIAKPTEFNASNLVGTTDYVQLSEAGQRDLVNYAIQIASEITREKDEYQFITSEIQKDLF